NCIRVRRCSEDSPMNNFERITAAIQAALSGDLPPWRRWRQRMAVGVGNRRTADGAAVYDRSSSAKGKLRRLLRPASAMGAKTEGTAKNQAQRLWHVCKVPRSTRC